MANIVLATRCNLHCVYCFADDFVNNGKMEITDENFRKAAEFILSGDVLPAEIGLIGGEPTLHNHFSDYVKMLTSDSRVDRVIVYTNGIRLKSYPEVIKNKKVRFLINCNPREAIGEANYSDTMDVLKMFVSSRRTENVSLGVNLYTGRGDYSYIIELLKVIGRDRLRVSITVPNNTLKNNAFEYFKMMKPIVFKLFGRLSAEGIIPYFDCNHLPPCFITEDDIKQFSGNNAMLELIYNTLSGAVSCRPIVDIFPNLTAVRCLGMSEYMVQNIGDFANLADLKHFYLRSVDAFAHNCYADESCRNCYKMKTTKCSGGCLCYKTEEIQVLREMVLRKSGEMLNEKQLP